MGIGLAETSLLCAIELYNNAVVHNDVDIAVPKSTQRILDFGQVISVIHIPRCDVRSSLNLQRMGTHIHIGHSMTGRVQHFPQFDCQAIYHRPRITWTCPKFGFYRFQATFCDRN
jgi:hypothetical protein